VLARRQGNCRGGQLPPKWACFLNVRMGPQIGQFQDRHQNVQHFCLILPNLGAHV